MNTPPTYTSSHDAERAWSALQNQRPSATQVNQFLEQLLLTPLSARIRSQIATRVAGYVREAFPAHIAHEIVQKDWPLEVRMALRDVVAVPTSTFSHDAGLTELAGSAAKQMCLIFIDANDDEHSVSMLRMRKYGLHCVRVNSASEAVAVTKEHTVIGIIAGTMWWDRDQAHAQLQDALHLSNLAWLKLARAPAWKTLELTVYDSCRKIYFSDPSASYFAVEDQAALSDTEIQGIRNAARDFLFGGSHLFRDFYPRAEHEDVIRASLSRYLKANYPALSADDQFEVRLLSQKRPDQAGIIVSASNGRVAIVMKISYYIDAHDEAKRFLAFAHSTSVRMSFFCHGEWGVLVFAPTDPSFGFVRSLDDWLNLEGLKLVDDVPKQASIQGISAAVAALLRLSKQREISTYSWYCSLDVEETILTAFDPLRVAGQEIPLIRLWKIGQKAVDECEHIIQHGDMHPGNLLLTSSGNVFLIDFQCAGYGPPFYDLSMLWVNAMASHFIPVLDETNTTQLIYDLLGFHSTFEEKWLGLLRFAVNYEVIHLTLAATQAKLDLAEHAGVSKQMIYDVLAFILCREVTFCHGAGARQQFVVRCATAAVAKHLNLT